MTEPAPNPSRIMIVDDTPQNLQLLEAMLREQGCQVFALPNGEMALRAAARTLPDLILLDIMMPGMDGYEVCTRLKADPQTRDIPVLFLSALHEPWDKVRAFRVGGVDYITKPFQIEEVDARVRAHLRLRHLQQELTGHNAQLEVAVSRRTRELAEAHARLAVLDQAKSDFLRLISHELRTPLHGIFGAAELLLLTCGQDPAVAEYAGIYQSSRRRLMTLLDDAQLLTQIGVGAVASANAHCLLGEVMAHACQQALPLAHSRGIQLSPAPSDPGCVQGAEGHLVRALQALLETAAKFAGAGTTVRLSLAPAPAGQIELWIQAEGRGIPAGAVPRFFELLAIEEPLILGDDLGLAPPLAARIVALYGGSVSVANLVPPGLRLVVCLRVAEANS
jgi:DNA-binding response OmpR family regulator